MLTRDRTGTLKELPVVALATSTLVPRSTVGIFLVFSVFYYRKYRHLDHDVTFYVNNVRTKSGSILFRHKQIFQTQGSV